MKKTKNYREIFYQLNSQLDKLKLFCELWDKGNEDMTQEIAVKLRVIFHQTKNSHSLIHMLDLDDIIYLSATSSLTPPGYLGLLTIRINTIDLKMSLVPGVHKRRKEMSLNEWWDEEPIIVDFNNKKYTRKKLILDVANTDGGAHVDWLFDQNYYELSRNPKLGFTISGSFNGTVKDNPIPPTIRKIAEEVVETFELNEAHILSLLDGKWDDEVNIN